MANYCSNWLKVTNLTEEGRRRLLDSLTVEDNFPELFVPEPDWGEPEGETVWAWRVKYWGTISPAEGVQVDEEDNTQLNAYYGTALSPLNEDCIARISRALPDALLTVKYYEPGCDILGVMMARKGVVVDMEGEVSTPYNRWAVENEYVIQAAIDKSDTQDEETITDIVIDLWAGAEFDYVDAMQEEIVELLLPHLEEREKMAKTFWPLVPTGSLDICGTRMSAIKFFRKLQDMINEESD